MNRFILVLLGCSLCLEVRGAEMPTPRVREFIAQNCVDCHDGTTKEAGLDLTTTNWQPEDRGNFERWIEIFDRVHARKMPPAEADQPTDEARHSFEKALGTELNALSAARQKTNGRTVLRRLNRVEYENSLHDLLDIRIPLQQLLPEDTPAHGYDTVAEGLRFSQLQMEKYLEAADAALDAAIHFELAPEPTKKRYTYKEEKGIRENLDTPEGTIRDPVSKQKHHIIFKELDDAVVFFSDGYSPTDLRQFSSRVPGDYRLRISAYGHQTQGHPAMMTIYADNFREKRLLGFFDMPADEARVVDLRIQLRQNEHLKIEPYGTGFDEQGQDIWKISGPAYKGSGLAVQWVEVEGPLYASWPPPSMKAVFGELPIVELPENKRKWQNNRRVAYELRPADPAADLRKVVERFASRAFRRPIESNEADRFVQLGEDQLSAGKPFEQAVRVALRGILCLPQFLILEETPGRLNDYALASRLSYFLWSTTPDEQLLQLAHVGKLAQSEVLREQTNRLLDDPRAQQFVHNFVGQWLDLRRIDATSPDMRLYPEFDNMLQLSMVGETEAFFHELLAKNLSIDNLIHSDFLMLNRRIAEHYGIDSVVGEDYQHVALPAGSPRGGILTQASVLKVTANGTVTSPVMRGAWVMKRLLGEPPAPPPPVPAIEPDTRGTTTIRELLAKHRSDATCASCHQDIDPPGFALESFDVIGGYRERYRSLEKGDRPQYKLRGRDIYQYKLALPVDASGELPDGRTFQIPPALSDCSWSASSKCCTA